MAVPLDVALPETDQQIAGNGIAAAYHALSVSWEPGLRSVARAGGVVDALARLAPRFLAENRVELRWETLCAEGLALVDRAVAGPLTPSLTFNDHTSMMMLDPVVPMQERHFDLDPDHPTADPASDGFRRAMERRAARLGVSAEAHAEGRPPAPLWRLVSANAARAMGLANRGEVAPGRRADPVLRDWPEGEAPAPHLLLAGGSRARSAEPAGA